MDKLKRTDFHYASINDDLGLIQKLLSEGTTIDQKDSKGWTALHFAAQEGHIKILNLLISEGANVESENSFGKTALGIAVTNYRGNGETIEFLLANGADPYHKNKYGVSPIDNAIQIANYDVAKYFSGFEHKS